MPCMFRHKHFRPLAVAIRVLLNGVCISICLCPYLHLCGYFLGIGVLIFFKFANGITAPIEAVHDRARFNKIKSLPQKWPKMRQKSGFLKLLKNLFINFFCIRSAMTFMIFAMFWYKSHFCQKLFPKIWAEMPPGN